jgi:hypothetical protein
VRIEPVLRYLLEPNDPNVRPNNVIEVEAPDRISTRGCRPPSSVENHRCTGNSRREEDIEEMGDIRTYSLFKNNHLPQ